MTDTPERIYLIPNPDNGGAGYDWCDTPAPGADMAPKDATEYVRADIHAALVRNVERQMATIIEHDGASAHLIAENERLRGKVAELENPDLFWDADAPEEGLSSADEALYEAGHLDYARVQRAHLLPDVFVVKVVTRNPEDGKDYESCRTFATEKKAQAFIARHRQQADAGPWLHRMRDAPMPHQTWQPFPPDTLVEVKNKRDGEALKGFVRDFWWGYADGLESATVIFYCRAVDRQQAETREDGR